MSGKINWRSIVESKPEDEQECLVKFKHGYLSGYYQERDENFRAYVWHDLEFYGEKWVPIDEVKA